MKVYLFVCFMFIRNENTVCTFDVRIKSQVTVSHQKLLQTVFSFVINININKKIKLHCKNKEESRRSETKANKNDFFSTVQPPSKDYFRVVICVLVYTIILFVKSISGGSMSASEQALEIKTEFLIWFCPDVNIYILEKKKHSTLKNLSFSTNRHFKRFKL